MAKDTETIDRLYLELSQFTRAEICREIVLRQGLMSICDLGACIPNCGKCGPCIALGTLNKYHELVNK